MPLFRMLNPSSIDKSLYTPTVPASNVYTPFVRCKVYPFAWHQRLAITSFELFDSTVSLKMPNTRPSTTPAIGAWSHDLSLIEGLLMIVPPLSASPFVFSA